MTSATLREALSRATDTVDAAVGRGVLAEAGRRIVAQLGDGPYLVVADENTWALGGERLTEVLVEAGAAVADPLIFPGRPVLYASYDNCVTIKEAMGDALPIALGSGTLNDLVKLAAFEGKAPAHVIEQERQRLGEWTAQRDALAGQRARLG